MTDGIDPRLARRRREVQEASARRRLRWTIWVLAVAVVAGLVIAVLQSSWLAVESITVEGAENADVAGIMSAAGVEEGVAMISIRAGSIEDQLRADPWIAEAKVRVVWPRQIEVMVVEHIPIARVKSGSTWLVSSPEGTVVARGQRLVEPYVDIESVSLRPGDSIEDATIIAALEFVAALPIELKSGLVIGGEETDLVATVQGHEVLLGATTDMAQKAVTLAVLLNDGVPAEASINLVSPVRPAVTNPQPEVETSQEVTTQTSGSG
ncbi:MAG: FtsQ-type POTRA domain-containing protein [Acidimicrobiia bacterium]|nr:FtsQ-type POTRA domain-containing protein [Acidimicrobiia bacterium]